MNLYPVAVALLVGAGPLWAQNNVSLTGTIGPYEIEMELDRQDDPVVGRYRYAGREAWLDLSGEIFAQDAMRLDESVNGEQTGAFYLNITDAGVSGFWAHEETDYPTELIVTDGALERLFDRVDPPELSSGLTGQYSTATYWVNSLFAPNYEIGYNGGTANVVSVGDDQILVSFTFLVGPTYHFAVFQGLAKRVGPDTFVHNAVLDGGSEPCTLEFQFDDIGLAITDEGNGYACQFGARAHANFSLSKTSDTAEFDGSW